MIDYTNSFLLPLIASLIAGAITSLISLCFEYFIIQPFLRKETSNSPSSNVFVKKPFLRFLISKRIVIFTTIVIVAAALAFIWINNFAPRINPENISPIYLGQSVNGTLGNDESLEYKFSTATNALILIKVQSVGGFKPTLILYTEKGKEIKNTYDLNGFPAIIEFAPMPYTTYIISVHGVKENGVFAGGSFILEINESK